MLHESVGDLNRSLARALGVPTTVSSFSLHVEAQDLPRIEARWPVLPNATRQRSMMSIDTDALRRAPFLVRLELHPFGYDAPVAANISYRLKVFHDANGEWRWRIFARNGKIVADSAEGYASRRNALRAAHALCGAKISIHEEGDAALRGFDPAVEVAT